ncbi:MAG TPA: response regulator transcription factor [Gemmatimonadales bacterium]
MTAPASTPAKGLRLLTVEDDAVARAMISALLRAAGHDVTEATDGEDAWNLLAGVRYRVVVSDWQMPRMDGLELCRRLREPGRSEYVYFILLTSRASRADYLEAMAAGVDDFLTKPVDPAELSARLGVARRILGLHQTVQQLEGLLPICSYCKRIRSSEQAWTSLESYVEKRSAAEFSHGICPDCYAKHIEPNVR